MSIEFRYAAPEELEAVIHVTRHSFPGVGRTPESWGDQFRSTVYGDGTEIIWVGVEAGSVIASCQLHRLTHWVSGVEMPAMGLGTVAMAATHRQRGIAGQLVTTALRAARERGDLLSSLYPFRATFYARMGYGLAGDAHQYHLAPAALPGSDERMRMELVVDGNGVEEVAAFYDRWAASQTGQVKRSSAVWQELAGKPDRVLASYRGVDGGVEGYVLASYPVQLAAEERYLSVEEHAWTTPAARRGIYGWLSSLGDQWRAIAIRALPQHRLEDWVGEPRYSGAKVPGWSLWFPSAVLLRGPMFRLLDLAAAWSARRVDPEAALTVALDVQDPQFPEDAGEWRLRLEDGAVRPDRSTGPADLHLALNAETLARIFMGSLPPTAAAEAGLAEVQDPAGRLPALDQALRLPQAWTFDRY